MSVPVLSRLFIACRETPPRGGQAVTIHGPTLHSPASEGPETDLHQSASRLPASRRSPTDPALRANPYPEVTDPFCRLPLPTLFYQLEAVHLGDLMRLSVRPGAKIVAPSDFHGPSGAHRTPQQVWRFAGQTTLSPANLIPGCRVR